MTTNLTLTSTVTPSQGTTPPSLEISLISSALPSLKADEILVRVEASPINPSDAYALLQFADLKTLSTTQDSKTGLPVTRATLPFTALKSKTSVQPGNEGAGEVIAAGTSPTAQRLLGKKVALYAWGEMAMYSQYKVIKASKALELLPGTTSAEGAACFINPFTVLGFLETMKTEGFKGIVHTAAASQLGQQLVKACQAEKIPLVNIVRKQEQVEILKRLGAEYVVNSSLPTFAEDLEEAIAKTGAYLAFDATGGGTLVNSILTAMEKAASRDQPVSRYGTATFKKVYIYGGLDSSPTVLHRSYGLSWGVEMWLFSVFLAKIGPQKVEQLRQRIAREVKTTFATSYDREISLAEAVQSDIIRKYATHSTGGKFLINPSKGLSSKL